MYDEIEHIPQHPTSFDYIVASRGFHYYQMVSWHDLHIAQPVEVQYGTELESLKVDRYACAVKKRPLSSILINSLAVTVGHVPLEISKFCYFFMQYGGHITGKVVDVKSRRSPIPSGGLEIKLQLTFTGQGEKIVKMRRLLIDAYSWDYTGQQADDSDDEEILEL